MTKKEIVKTICDRANKQQLMKGNLTQLATKEIVQWTFEAIIETLVQEGRIELRNFGVFEVKQRKPRKARNPRTGARVDVEAKNVVTFQPGKEMEEQVKQYAKLAEAKKKPRKSKAPKAEPKIAEPKEPEAKLPVPSVNGTGAAPDAPPVPIVPVPPAVVPAPEPVTSDTPVT
ncbi:HU family DNA-binding protein [Frigoriglobus tundricola]|uniref:Integration host factor beta subunit n=1 Tax=Frigoriglobus tundricola TaxID=2774151 RepID=A0A6M5YUN8_9BACT|nr:HU family DNA-binding protein [Frigoriglobus tundricola]QJW97768.1 Integration host factor beta subunit [Frigoriglobus tundricola]